MLTAAERAYDFEMTFMRGYREEVVLEHGIQVGILSDYLAGEPEDYTDLTRFDDLHDLYLSSVQEGRECQRFDYTAEELFIWAHEFDKENL